MNLYLGNNKSSYHNFPNPTMHSEYSDSKCCGVCNLWWMCPATPLVSRAGRPFSVKVVDGYIDMRSVLRLRRRIGVQTTLPRLMRCSVADLVVECIGTSSASTAAWPAVTLDASTCFLCCDYVVNGHIDMLSVLRLRRRIKVRTTLPRLMRCSVADLVAECNGTSSASRRYS